MATTSPASDHRCKDCRAKEGTQYASVSIRPAPHPGPRCATHHRRFKQEQKAARHEKYVARTYSLDYREYDQLYVGQGGTCAICQRATGATRKLSVDHDHTCCSGGVSCGYCVRGLLCRPCNDLLGQARDQVEFFRRAINYLKHPPALEILGKVRRDVYEHSAGDARELGGREPQAPAGADDASGGP